MPLVDNINVPPENAELFAKACVVRNGFFGTKVDKKNIVWRKRNFSSLIARSAMPTVGELWDSLTAGEQSDWDDAGYWAGMSGWDLFAQDTIYRKQNGLQGMATPNLYHQFKVMMLRVEAPATILTVRQIYTLSSNVEVSGAINVICDLTSVGSGSYAIWKVKVETGYWNDDIGGPDVIYYEIDLTEFTSWDYPSWSYIDGFIGNGKITYTIEIYNMQGVVYIDGVEFNYNDQNFANDFQCDSVQGSWERLNYPFGVTAESIYPPDNI